MKILGIETSCDETAISIINGENNNIVVEKSVVLSQIQTHRKYGGVVPEVAGRKHIEAIFTMLENEILPNGDGVDAIAVTAGPGLAPALRVGVETAKALSWLWNKSLIPICHLEGHIYANWLSDIKPKFPALCLIVSGGHTELVLMTDYQKFERIGETLDDAVGEAFDKVAKMIGSPYPGGPEIARLAENGDKTRFDFPRGLANRPNFDFSFSGIKTSVLYTLRKMDEITEQDKADVAASFQEAVVDILIKKTIKAIKKYKLSAVVLAGGVSANIELRARLKKAGIELGVEIFIPPFEYSVDNAVMIAVAGYFRAQNKDNFIKPEKLKADPNLDIV